MITPKLPKKWEIITGNYLDHLRAGGHPETTVDTRRQHLHYLGRRIGTDPEHVTTDHLIAWSAAQTWAQETRRSRLNTYRLFWRWAHDVGQLDTNAAANLPRVRPFAGIPRPAPDRIYMRATMRTDPRTRLILRLAAECGLRRAEIAVIHTRDLIEDLVGWSLLVHGKGRRQRVVPLTDVLAAQLLAHAPGYVFPGKIDGHLSPRRVGELAAEALDDGWTLHTLRHRFATRTYSIDHDTFSVQQLLGHASAETTRRYVALDQTRLRALVERAAS